MQVEASSQDYTSKYRGELQITVAISCTMIGDGVKMCCQCQGDKAEFLVLKASSILTRLYS
jgi:hypothetical protein